MSESLKGPRGLEIVVGPGNSRGPEDLRGLTLIGMSYENKKNAHL